MAIVVPESTKDFCKYRRTEETVDDTAAKHRSGTGGFVNVQRIHIAGNAGIKVYVFLGIGEFVFKVVADFEHRELVLKK
jgi:hypothetical protein